MTDIGETMGGMSQSQQATKDEIGPDDKVTPIFIIFREKLEIEELSTVVSTRGIGDSMILGHATNGKLGDSRTPIILGDDRDAAVVERVVNPNNTFKEFFRATTFKAGATTADWDVTVHDLELTDTEVAQSLQIYLNNDTIYNAKITLTTDDSLSNTTIQLSADGGSHWETVTNDVEHTFTDTGKDLRFKLTQATTTVTITKIVVTYN